MPTKRSVDNIKSKLLRPALTSHFEVEIPIPTKLKERGETNQLSFLEYNGINLNADQQDKLHLLCSEASLPGSSLATLEINNDYTGVTERHAYRRIYDDRIDLTFYVDTDNYLPIHLFETWIKFIVDESIGRQESKGNVGSKDLNYFYRVRYPEEYMAAQGLKVIKFERDYRTSLEYEFINAFPISVSSMPISYESSSLLKCTVSMSYIRYILVKGKTTAITDNLTTPQQQAYFNSVDPYLQNPQFSVGGVPNSVAKASGNSIYTSDSTGPQSTLGRAFENT